MCSAPESHSAGHMCSIAEALKCGKRTTEKEMLKKLLKWLNENWEKQLSYKQSIVDIFE